MSLNIFEDFCSKLSAVQTRRDATYFHFLFALPQPSEYLLSDWLRGVPVVSDWLNIFSVLFDYATVHNVTKLGRFWERQK